MAKSKLVKQSKKIAEAVVGGYRKIETTVTDGYETIERSVTGTYEKIENAFVDQYLTHDGETVADAKKRLREAQSKRDH